MRHVAIGRTISKPYHYRAVEQPDELAEQACWRSANCEWIILLSILDTLGFLLGPLMDAWS